MRFSIPFKIQDSHPCSPDPASPQPESGPALLSPDRGREVWQVSGSVPPPPGEILQSVSRVELVPCHQESQRKHGQEILLRNLQANIDVCEGCGKVRDSSRTACSDIPFLGSKFHVFCLQRLSLLQHWLSEGSLAQPLQALQADLNSLTDPTSVLAWNEEFSMLSVDCEQCIYLP